MDAVNLIALEESRKQVVSKGVTFGTEKEAIVQTFVYDQAVSCDKEYEKFFLPFFLHFLSAWIIVMGYFSPSRSFIVVTSM
ncbi:hypothetical protein D918_03966 [Trichuris suis]|nr:hypothetical protein D918_03966 [Trichuris suis]